MNDQYLEATSVILDMTASTAMLRRIGLRHMQLLKNDLLEIVPRIAAKYSGKVVDLAGDGGLVIFEGEQSILKCCTFCRDLLAETSETNTNERGEYTLLLLRFGIDHGTIAPVLGGRYYIGDSLNMCGRLVSICKSEQVLVTDVVAKYAKKMGLAVSAPNNVELKGFGYVPIAEFLWNGKERGIGKDEDAGDGPPGGGGGPSSPRPPDAPRQPAFTITVDTLSKKQLVRDVDLPLVVEGRYEGSVDSYVWVVLEDSYGNLYLQHPDVRFLPDGKWIARNVIPGKGIVAVRFVRVDDAGHSYFLEMVARRAWGGFVKLPENHQLLQSVEITRVD